MLKSLAVDFLIRPAQPNDLTDLHRLATSLSAYGFLTLPADRDALEEMATLSADSFAGRLEDPDRGKYLFVLEDHEKRKVVGTSLIVARHGDRFKDRLLAELLPPFAKDGKSPFWESLGQTGLPVRFGVKSGNTEGSLMNEMGAESIVIGPGESVGNIHAPNEYNEISQIHKAVEFYTAFLRQF